MIKKRYPFFVPPDLQDQRGDRLLMVWGDLPYWIVIDSELRDLLFAMDGCSSLDEIMRSVSGYKRKREARRAIELLTSRRVVSFKSEVKSPKSDFKGNRIENIAINVTHRCNLRCPFCYNFDNLKNSPEHELSLAEITDVLDASRQFWGKSPALSILGGEPLFAKEKTLGLINFAHENGLVPIVSTNGTLVTPDFAECAARQSAEIQVSIDGASEETNDPVRGKGNFDRALSGVRNLIDAGAHTILSMVCHKGNFHELKDFYELGLSLGVDEVRFIPLKRIGGAGTSGFEPVPLDEMITSAVSLFRDHPEFKTLTGRDAFSILASSCKHAIDRVSCGTGIQTFLLDANGDIYPCLNTNTPSLLVANIRESDFSFADVWCNSPVLDTVRRSTSVCNEQNACKGCEMRHWCLGGCRGETLATRGELRLYAWNCGEQKRALIETMWALSETSGIVRLAHALEC